MLNALLSISREHFCDKAQSNKNLLTVAKPYFDEFVQEVRSQDPCQSIQEQFVEAAKIATEHPKALYRFFQLYNYLNAEIASTIASLVGNIGKSRSAFIDPSIPVPDEADYSFEIANWVKIASIDEYQDPNLQDENTYEGVSHRVLASGLLKAIGNYAGMSDQERREFTIPSWLIKLGDDIQEVYSGHQGDCSSLAQGIGAHIYSEFSADSIEFSNACKLLFIDKKNQGLHAYLQQYPLITLGKNTFQAASWLKTHGGYDEKDGVIHGVEFVHLETGFIAAAMMVAKVIPEDRQKIVQDISRGIGRCRTLLGQFFTQAKIECQNVIANELAGSLKDSPNEPQAIVNRCRALGL